MFRSKTDAQWAHGMGIDVDLFLGKKPMPSLDLRGVPCGEDDAIAERYDAVVQMIRLRKEWGNDPDRCENFGDYVRKYFI